MYVFKRPAKIGKKLFAKSAAPQHLTDEELEHWFTKALLKDGHIVEVAKPAKAEPAAEVKAQAAEPEAEEAPVAKAKEKSKAKKAE